MLLLPLLPLLRLGMELTGVLSGAKGKGESWDEYTDTGLFAALATGAFGTVLQTALERMSGTLSPDEISKMATVGVGVIHWQRIWL